MKKVAEYALIFCIGAISYGTLEILWRQYTHWSMLLAGGICFLSMYIIFNRHPHMGYILRGLTGSLIITSVELLFGCIFNIWLKMNVWDYSRFRLNLLGQICLLYSTLWGILSIPVSVLCIKLKGIFEHRGAKAGYRNQQNS